MASSCGLSSNKKRPSPSNDSDLHHHKRLHQSSFQNLSSLAASQSLGPSPALVASANQQESRFDSLQREIKMLFELEYQDQVIEYMHSMDAQTRPSVETIDLQPELQWYMRPYLIDFLIEIHQQYRLRPETLYLAINIIDRYVSKRVVFKKHYQLVGCSALWIAAKFEDSKDRVPTVAELAKMCCGAYEESSFIQMEGHVLSTIDWKLGHPTPESWLRVYSIGAHRPSDAKLSSSASIYTPCLESSTTGHLARFIMELSLFHRSYVGLRSCHIAAAALILSRYILGQPRRFEEECKEALPVVKLLDAHLGDHFSKISAVVIKKYSYGHYSGASRIAKDWYDHGHRFRSAEDDCTRILRPLAINNKPINAQQPLPASASAPNLSGPARKRMACSSSSASLSSNSTLHHSNNHHHQQMGHLTPSSISSLSLDSSPTSSVSSFMSSSISSVCSPHSTRSSSSCSLNFVGSKPPPHHHHAAAAADPAMDNSDKHSVDLTFTHPSRGDDDKENQTLRSVGMFRQT